MKTINEIAKNFVSDWVDCDNDFKKNLFEISTLIKEAEWLRIHGWNQSTEMLDEMRDILSEITNKARHIGLYLDKLRFGDDRFTGARKALQKDKKDVSQGGVEVPEG